MQIDGWSNLQSPFLLLSERVKQIVNYTDILFKNNYKSLIFGAVFEGHFGGVTKAPIFVSQNGEKKTDNISLLTKSMSNESR